MATVEDFLNLSMDERRADAETCIQKRGDDHCPVIVYTKNKSAPKATKYKYAIGGDAQVGHLIAAVRSKIPDLDAATALFVFIKKPDGEFVLTTSTSTVREVYDEYAHEDKFLHMVYMLENTFGFNQSVAV